MAGAADQIAEQMGRNAEQAMNRITQQMEGLVRELRTLAEHSRAAGNEAMAQAAARIAEAGESFGSAARAISNSLEQTVAGITDRLGGEAEAATKRMTEQLTRAIAAMQVLAEENRAAGNEAVRAMADRIGEAAAGFERSAAKVAEALNAGAGDAATRLTGAVEELRDHFVRLAAELSGNMEKAGSHFEQQSRDGASALTDAAHAAAAALKTGGIESGEAVRVGGSDASRGIQTAAGELATPLRELGQRITTLQTEALELERSLGIMRQAALDATTPLQAAAADLVKVGASGQKSSADLALAAQHIGPLADTITGTMRQLGDAEERLATLSQKLDSALGGFADLDASLGRVFKDLREGLGGFATQVAAFVKETNQEMAQAVTVLSGAVSELGEVLDEGEARRAAD
jgi:chromosome segregation ATPase